MNNQIKELIKQATEVRQPAPHSNQTENSIVFNKEKFAELLIKECVNVMEITDITDFRGVELALKIKKHFGVK